MTEVKYKYKQMGAGVANSDSAEYRKALARRNNRNNRESLEQLVRKLILRVEHLESLLEVKRNG